MLFYLRIALRNLRKNSRRSIKTILTIVIGLGACLLAQGFIAHTLWGLRESLINGGTGHLQIYRQGHLEHGIEQPYRYRITAHRRVIAALKGVPGIERVAPRLAFQGIASAGEKSAVFSGMAGLAREERLLNSFSTLARGRFLDERNPLGVVIGSGLARRLGVDVGDPITIMSTLESGVLNALDLEVAGVIQAQIKAYDDAALIADLTTVQRFLDQPGAVDRIIVLLQNTGDLERVAPAVERIGHRLGLEWRDWRALTGKQYTQPKIFYKLVYVLIMTVIILVVVLSIANTLNLTIQERIREIGTIRSLGTTRWQVAGIFIAESLVMGIVGGLVGIMAGYGLAALCNGLGGIPIPPPPGQARGYTAFFRPGLWQALGLWVVFLATAMAAGAFPAYRAARLRIVEALCRA